MNVGITDGRPGLLVQCSMLLDGMAPDLVDGMWECRLRLDSLPLRPRVYFVYCDVFNETGHGQYMTWVEALTVRVVPEGYDAQAGVMGDVIAGPVLVDYSWQT